MYYFKFKVSQLTEQPLFICILLCPFSSIVPRVLNLIFSRLGMMCAARQILVCRGWAALLARPPLPPMGGPPHNAAAMFATAPDQSAAAAAAPQSEVVILLLPAYSGRNKDGALVQKILGGKSKSNVL